MALQVPADSPFTIDNLPFGVGRQRGAPTHAFIAIGDHALDLHGAVDEGLLEGLGLPDGVFATGSLNAFLALGSGAWSAVRGRVQQVLDEALVGEFGLSPDVLVPRDELEMLLPVEVGDYVDFYSSIHHATNLGKLLRPGTEPLLPNWRHLPVSYTGRAGTVVVSGTPVTRPNGLSSAPGADGPAYGPSTRLDIELEVAAVIGAGSELGSSIEPDALRDHVVGLALLNDWSARDIQAYEYQPLGPHLGKSFATSLSPWIVTLDALEPFRVPPPRQDPPPADHLRAREAWGYAIELEVLLESSRMRAEGCAPEVISRTGFADLYWTLAQQLAHLTTNGASTRPGDLYASGTVSGPARGSEGSLIELTRNGAEPLVLPTGEERRFLEDGDRVLLRGWCQAGERRVGFGEVVGTIVPARGGGR
jgi:fumarylacetoacetase